MILVLLKVDSSLFRYPFGARGGPGMQNPAARAPNPGTGAVAGPGSVGGTRAGIARLLRAIHD